MPEVHEDIITMVSEGDLDEHLTAILDAVYRRRALVLDVPEHKPSRRDHGHLNKDDRVRFNSGVRPKYMEGELATVLKNSGSHVKTVQLQLDSKKGRFEGEKIRAYKSTLDVIE